MSRFFTLQGNQNNFWSQVKDFSYRGGFYNGLNPAVIGRIWYVNANTITDQDELRGPVGSDSNTGTSPLFPFATVARALEFADCYDTIVVAGVIREQVSAPVGLSDITIIGAANQPRQATSDGVPNGGGSTWLAPTSPVALTPLLQIVNQGWIVKNIFFGTVASTPAIRLKRQESAAFPDASHVIIDGCQFFTQGLSTEIGIGSESLFKGRILNCVFQGLSGTAILGESVSIAQPQDNVIDSCFFRECANAIDWPMSYGIINNNRFKDITTTKIDVNVGADNYVGINFFDDVEADIDPAHGYIGNASDCWRNWSSDQAALTVANPPA